MTAPCTLENTGEPLQTQDNPTAPWFTGAKTVCDYESHKISQLMLDSYTGNDLQVKARLSIEEAKAEEAEKSNSAIWITGLLGIRNNINYVLNPKNKINYIFNTDLSVSEAEQDTTAVITTAMMVYGGAKGLNALKNRLNAARGAAAKGISVGTEPYNVGGKMLTEGGGKGFDNFNALKKNLGSAGEGEA